MEERHQNQYFSVQSKQLPLSSYISSFSKLLMLGKAEATMPVWAQVLVPVFMGFAQLFILPSSDTDFCCSSVALVTVFSLLAEDGWVASTLELCRGE